MNKIKFNRLTFKFKIQFQGVVDMFLLKHLHRFLFIWVIFFEFILVF